MNISFYISLTYNFILQIIKLNRFCNNLSSFIAFNQQINSKNDLFNNLLTKYLVNKSIYNDSWQQINIKQLYTINS